MRLNITPAIVALTLLSACAHEPRSIGAATMRADGTIEMQLRAEGPGGIVGDALFVYPPDHPQYADMLAHVGGLQPGESKPVPPWD
jgi:hypothetical protein